jgi:hypothetical protein
MDDLRSGADFLVLDDGISERFGDEDLECGRHVDLKYPCNGRCDPFE